MNEITTRTEHIILEDSGIIRCKAFKYSEHTLEDAKENIDAVRILAKGKKVPVFVDITEVKGADREAREYLSSKETGDIQSACALLVGSALSRLVGNFFLGLNKTPFPTRLFTDEKKAIDWLKTFL
jgi:hypothetical protein